MADRVVYKDYYELVAGQLKPAGPIPIKLHDNSDGTWSESSSSGSGSAGYGITEQQVLDSASPPVAGVRRVTISPTGTITIAYFNSDGTTWTPTGAVQPIAPSLIQGVKPSTNVTSTAAEAGHIIKNAAGVLFSLSVFNSATFAQFYQLHDAVSAPAASTVPKSIIKVAAGGVGGWDYGMRGRSFATGIYVTNSSVGGAYTVGAADSFFDAQIQ